MKAFIPAALDDYPLSPAQFRIFCHISRRDQCWESVPNMAKHCGLNRETVWKALKHLEKTKLIIKSRRPGQSSLFMVTEIEQWSQPGRKESPTPKTVHHPDGKRVWDPDGKRAYKGNPNKEIPLRKSPELKNGDSQEWKAGWEEMKKTL